MVAIMASIFVALSLFGMVCAVLAESYFKLHKKEEYEGELSYLNYLKPVNVWNEK